MRRFHCPTNPDFTLTDSRTGRTIRFSGGHYETDDPSEVKSLSRHPSVEELHAGDTVETVEGDLVLNRAAVTSGHVPSLRDKREQLNAVAISIGIDPSGFATKEDLLAAIQAKQATDRDSAGSQYGS